MLVKLPLITSFTILLPTQIKRNLRETDFEKLGNVVFRWFLSKRNQNLPLDGNLIKGKAITFTKELGYNNFHGPAGWLDRWKKR